MPQRISPARSISGSITLPGDKSISHRYAMIASIAEGPSRIRNYSTGADCHSTLGRHARAGRARGRERNRSDDPRPRLGRPARAGGGSGRGQLRFHHPHVVRHSGGAAVHDAHRRRRIALPPADGSHHRAALQDGRAPSPRAMGAFRRSRSSGARLQPIDYTLPVPSAQVKTCVLFARIVRGGRDHRARAGAVARSHRNRAARIRRGLARGRQDHHAHRPAHAQRARSGGSVGPFFSGVLYRGGAAAARLAPQPSAASG